MHYYPNIIKRNLEISNSIITLHQKNPICYNKVPIQIFLEQDFKKIPDQKLFWITEKKILHKKQTS